MVATNDDLLAEMQKQTSILKDLKKLIKGSYALEAAAEAELSKV